MGQKDEVDFRGIIQGLERERVKRLKAFIRIADPLTGKIMGRQLLLESVMAILRLKKEGVKNPGEFVLYKNHLVKRLLAIEDYGECLKETVHAFGLPPETVEKAKHSLSLLEIALERKSVERILSWTRLSVLSFATAVGFVFLKNVEVSNLRKIAYANAYGLKEELKDYVFAINA